MISRDRVTLRDVASRLTQMANLHGHAMHVLPRGLRLDLAIANGSKTLKLSRPAVLPSITEVQLVIDAFNVPRQYTFSQTETTVTVNWSS